MSDGETAGEDLEVSRAPAFKGHRCNECGAYPHTPAGTPGPNCKTCTGLVTARAKCDRWGVPWSWSWWTAGVLAPLVKVLEEIAANAKPFPMSAALPGGRLEAQAVEAAKLSVGLRRVDLLAKVSALLAELSDLEKGGA